MFRVSVGGFAPLLALAALSVLSPMAKAAEVQILPDGTSIRADDVARLNEAHVLEIYGAAVRQAFEHADSATLPMVIAALRGAPVPANDVQMRDLVGEWQCNMTKIGGASPAVIYPPFRCKIAVEGAGLSFEKLSGSQLTRGTLHRDGDRIVYLGVDFIRGDTPPAYADMPKEIKDPEARRNFPDVGLFEVLGPKQARIILPEPYLESTMNVLGLSR